MATAPCAQVLIMTRYTSMWHSPTSNWATTNRLSAPLSRLARVAFPMPAERWRLSASAWRKWRKPPSSNLPLQAGRLRQPAYILHNRYTCVRMRTRDVAKFRPLDHNNRITRYVCAVYVCGRLRWLAVFDHHSTTLRPPAICRYHHRNSLTKIVANTRFCMFWRPATPLSNVGQDYCIIFDTTCFRYLKQLVSNVEKALV